MAIYIEVEVYWELINDIFEDSFDENLPLKHVTLHGVKINYNKLVYEHSYKLDDLIDLFNNKYYNKYYYTKILDIIIIHPNCSEELKDKIKLLNMLN